MTDYAWPPSEEILRWRPSPTPPNDSVSNSALAADGEDLPTWVAVPANAEPGEDGEVAVRAYMLADVETDAGHPGGGGGPTVYAVPTVDGDLRIVIVNDDAIPFDSPIDRVPELPTLGELLRILDETLNEGETWGIGHPTRENSDTEHREELRSFVTIRSELYPQLEPLDQSRLEQWIAERP